MEAIPNHTSIAILNTTGDHHKLPLAQITILTRVIRYLGTVVTMEAHAVAQRMGHHTTTRRGTNGPKGGTRPTV